MTNKTLYVNADDAPTVERAGKLLKFYEDTSLSELLVNECRKVVERYDGKGELRKRITEGDEG